MSGQGGIIRLPASLRKRRWRIERQLDATGAQAILLVVTRRRERRVVKIYHRGIVPDADAHDALRRAEYDHVVRLYDSGLAEPEQCWYEMLEYIDGGTLADLIRDESEAGHLPEERVRQVLRELVAGISHLHDRLHIAHRDIKPKNILVRSRIPLNLAMADFGTASRLGDLSGISRVVQRTVAYAAPETGLGQVGYEADWWSLGMILVEALTGRHPFADADGILLSETEILNRLAREPVDLLVQGVPDDGPHGWYKLCRGLLRGNPSNRWRAAETLDWLDGKSTPAIREELRGPFAHRPLLFAGEELWDRRQVARALASRWTSAREVIGRNQLLEWVRDELADAPLAATLQDIGEAYDDLDVRLFFSILQLYPAVTPIFRGRPVDAQGLAQLADAALAESEGEGDRGPMSTSAILRALYDTHLLAELERVTGSRWHGEVDRRWREQMALVGRLADMMPPDARAILADSLPTAAAAALRVLVAEDSYLLARIKAAAAQAREAGLTDCDWFREVLRRGQAAAAVGAILPSLARAAQAPAQRARARRRADERRVGARRLKQFLLFLGAASAIVLLARTAV